jgi:hypothetical protein
VKVIIIKGSQSGISESFSDIISRLLLAGSTQSATIERIGSEKVKMCTQAPGERLGVERTAGQDKQQQGN